MKLTNPTDSNIENVIIEGEVYAVEAGETIEIPEKHAKFWKKYLHNFLELEDGESIEEPVVKEEKKSKKKPKKKPKKKAKKATKKDDKSKREKLEKLAEMKGIDASKFETLEDLEKEIKA
jgi:hypothetical protein